jgi:hypothetical protein
LEKLFQTLLARNYYFNVIINNIKIPARVEIHETRLVAGTFTQPSERPVTGIFQKIFVITTFSKLFFFQTFFQTFFQSLDRLSMLHLAMYAACQQDFNLILLVLGSLVVRLHLALAPAHAMCRVLRNLRHNS